MLLHTLPTLSYSIEDISIAGTESVPIDSGKTLHTRQCDHYALQLVVQFRVRSISRRSALAIVLPTTSEPLSIKLFYPFVDLHSSDDDEETVLLPLRLLLAQHEPFDIETEGHGICSTLLPQSRQSIKELRQHIRQLFSSFRWSSADDDHVNHLHADSIQASQFPVRYLSILQRANDDPTVPFHLVYQLPLGAGLPPLGPNLERLFHRLGLYENSGAHRRKEEKLDRLSTCFARRFSSTTSHCFKHVLVPYGSFRLVR